MNRLLAAITAGSVVLTSAAACTSAADSPDGNVRIATGSTTAVYHVYGTAIAELISSRLPGLEPTVLPSNASAQNITWVLQGDADVGFTQSDIAASKEDLVAPSPVGLVALARLYDDYFHLVVRDNAPVESLADLRGKRISVGVGGSGTAFTAERLLSVVDPQLRGSFLLETFNLDDSVAALRAERIDAFFFSGGLPVRAVADLAATTPVRLVDLSEYVVPMRKAFGEYYAERVVPATAYNKDKSVTTLGVPNYLVVRADMADDVAYALTKLLFDGQYELERAHPVGARLNPRSAISTPPLRLHPGAARYYRDRKG